MENNSQNTAGAEDEMESAEDVGDNTITNERIAKIAMTSENIENENLQKLRAVFPQFLRDGLIDFDALQAFFKKEGVLSEAGEKYGLSWAGKSKSYGDIRRPAKGTLTPQIQESKNWDNTENIFIEGENLEVLKLLQKKYANPGKIKMIYIDPPYNTGKDFIYKDNFTQNISDYYDQTGQTKDGIKLTSNPESNGRYHSDWLTMMYSRLFLARNMLRDDGVIFVSIDDHEVANLRMLMDEIFGEENFVGDFIWYKKLTGGYDNLHVNIQHEYILVYAKHKENVSIIPEARQSNYKLIDGDGRKYKWDSLWNIGGLTYSKSLDYPIIAPDGTEIFPIGERGVSFWLWSKTKVDAERDKLKFEKDRNGLWKVYKKIYASDGIVPGSMLDKDIVKGNTHSSAEMKNMFDGSKIFDYAKPTPLVKYLIGRATNAGLSDIVLDFFAGSGTTAHAVMQLNAEDGGNRKYVCVQLPEATDEKSEAFKAGYKNIAQISRERIRRAGEKIKAENKDKEGIEKLDIGFKSFALSPSNYRRWNVVTSKDDMETLMKQMKLFVEKPLVDNYDEQSVLYEVLLKGGFDLNSKPVQIEKDGVVYQQFTDDYRLITITFAKKLILKQIESLHLREDSIFVCFDSALTETEKINLSRNLMIKTI